MEKTPTEQKTIVQETVYVDERVNEPKNFIVALLLSIFLGALGIDRFYLNNIGLGVGKLVLWLLSGPLIVLSFGLLSFIILPAIFIWWLIDVILIATKNVNGVVWEK